MEMRAMFTSPCFTRSQSGASVDQQASAQLATEATHPPLVVSEIQNFLRRSLPAHFVPSVFMVLDALPLTPNGKIDRKALPLPSAQQAQSRANFVAPETPTEEDLAVLWAEILGSDHFGIHDNFFDCGGTLFDCYSTRHSHS